MRTGFEGKTQSLAVPEEIDGMRVEAVGNHSFSGRQDIISVSLPRTIRTIYGFAFHNCRNLKKISLFDSIDDYYDGVCRQCDSLSDIEITISRGWFEVIRNFLADSDRTLRFLIKENPETGNGVAPCRISSLTFPEYVYDFNENTMARTIQFSIAGSGMFYRECVDRRSINYREYDRLFEKGRIDGGQIAETIALGRLFYPVELEDSFRQEYEQYVKDSACSILKRLVAAAGEEREAKEDLRLLLDYNEKNRILPEKAIDDAIALSTEKKLTEISAMLMKSGRAGAAASMKFEF